LPYCPRCRCEYNLGVAECIDCNVPLVLHRPQRRPLLEIDTDELLVPLGAFVTLVMALGLFGLTQLARSGQLGEPLGPLIASQPICLTVFYAIAAILSGLILAISVLRWVFSRG
jgi:hypothetical protein